MATFYSKNKRYKMVLSDEIFHTIVRYQACYYTPLLNLIHQILEQFEIEDPITTA
jgi:hypothetical protein